MAEKLGKDNNPGLARWCQTHDRLECSKNRRHSRGLCHAAAIPGTDSCDYHDRLSPAAARIKGEAQITAWSAIGDNSAGVDYRMSVLAILQMSWLRLAFYSQMLGEQVREEGSHADPIAGPRVIDEDADLQDEIDREYRLKASGLIGYQYGAAGKEGRIYAQSEAVRALVTLESQERDRVVKYSETAHKMGISDRLTDLAENWGDIVATRITLILNGLALTPEQEALVPALITAHLSSIDMGPSL